MFMRHTFSHFVIIFFSLIMLSCGKEKKEEKKFEYKRTQSEQKKETTPKSAENMAITATIDLSNKGIGPVTSLTLASKIDQAMVTEGAEVFKKMCTACHRVGKRFIGPAPDGILERRSPEWIMNMILNPEEMVKNDPVAKQLLIEYNGAPMANQSLTEDQARAILEYFRTLK